LFPFVPAQISALFQYRDMLGRNYRYVVSCLLQDGRYSKIFENERVQERIRMDLPLHPTPPSDADAQLEFFLELCQHSLTCGQLVRRNGSWNMEDRGQWSTLG
jgi:hypothetical protein